MNFRKALVYGIRAKPQKTLQTRRANDNSRGARWRPRRPVAGFCDLEAPHDLEFTDSKEFGAIGMRHTVLLCRESPIFICGRADALCPPLHLVAAAEL
jgi:hypothetical protein